MEAKMKNFVKINAVFVCMVILLISSARASIVDVVGNWQFDYYVEDGFFQLAFDIKQENLSTGTFTGKDLSGWSVSGYATTDGFYLYDNYPYYPLGFWGGFSPQYTISGNMISYQATQWSGWFFTASGNGIAVTSVPEPSTWAMLLLGFAGLGMAAHRKRSEGIAFV
jgi:hypothetical protein